MLSADEVEAVLDAIADAYGPETTWVVGCGSLPRGIPGDIYATLVRRIHERGGRVAIDASGAPMAAAVPAGPDLIKPNRVELGELMGRDLGTLGEVVDAARELISGGVGEVLVSLGKDGAVLVTADANPLAAAVVERPVSTVAAGDCTLAGYLLARERGLDAADALAQAVAFGSAAVALPGSEVPGPDEVAAVRPVVVADPDLSMRLTD